jgi:putative addiction module component (TIGR02574 family)
MLADFDHLRQLPIADKLRIVEALWDDICESDEPFPISESIHAEVERRCAESKRNPSALLTRDELWRRVDENRG